MLARTSPYSPPTFFDWDMRAKADEKDNYMVYRGECGSSEEAVL